MQFIKAGMQTSIQDHGRSGQMHLGIAKSGAMDIDSMKIANWLVNKPLESPVLEVTLIGPEIKFTQPTSIAICGAEFDVFLNNKLITNNQTFHVHNGNILKFGEKKNGNRAYLAVSGEFNLKPVLSSFSTNMIAKFGGFHGRQLVDGDYLDIVTNHNKKNIPIKSIPVQSRAYYSGDYLLRCIPSVETGKFNKKILKSFYSQSYKISHHSNRMGIRLIGEHSVLENDIQITSSGLTQGSLQIPPSGQPIISSVDGQTIGGYPRIANIISADQSLLGQLSPGDKVNFVLIEPCDAIKIMKNSAASGRVSK